jgi:hypothetical protein
MRRERHVCQQDLAFWWSCVYLDPTWASINLGLLLCLECSGVHRSLGSHITKVRSLTLDNWDTKLLEVWSTRFVLSCNSSTC